MKEYRLNHVIYTLLQLTWGILQNIAGAIYWVCVFIRNPKRRCYSYHGAIVSEWRQKHSMGLGMFIFLGHQKESEEYRSKVLVHEYGHTIQSCLLGPLFTLVIGLTSTLWCFIPIFVKWRKAGRYKYVDFYPEKWANYEGRRVLHEEPIQG